MRVLKVVVMFSVVAGFLLHSTTAWGGPTELVITPGFGPIFQVPQESQKCDLEPNCNDGESHNCRLETCGKKPKGECAGCLHTVAAKINVKMKVKGRMATYSAKVEYVQPRNQHCWNKEPIQNSIDAAIPKPPGIYEKDAAWGLPQWIIVDKSLYQLAWKGSANPPTYLWYKDVQYHDCGLEAAYFIGTGGDGQIARRHGEDILVSLGDLGKQIREQERQLGRLLVLGQEAAKKADALLRRSLVNRRSGKRIVVQYVAPVRGTLEAALRELARSLEYQEKAGALVSQIEANTERLNALVSELAAIWSSSFETGGGGERVKPPVALIDPFGKPRVEDWRGGVSTLRENPVPDALKGALLLDSPKVSVELGKIGTSVQPSVGSVEIKVTAPSVGGTAGALAGAADKLGSSLSGFTDKQEAAFYLGHRK